MPSRMRTEGGEDADAEIAELVAAAFDDDIAIAGDAAAGGGLIFEVAQEVLGALASRECSSTRRVKAAARGVASSSRVMAPISRPNSAGRPAASRARRAFYRARRERG